jgi:hypothetical protein
MNIRFVMMTLCAIPLVASAGEIYGKITLNNAPVAAGTVVAAKCGAKAYPAVKTDASGTYNVVVAETGKCTLTVTVAGESAGVDVASYDDGAQADIVLEKKDGKLTARRR